jgi:hypothetical protein
VIVQQDVEIQHDEDMPVCTILDLDRFHAFMNIQKTPRSVPQTSPYPELNVARGMPDFHFVTRRDVH